MAAGRDPEEQQEDGGQAGMVVCLQEHQSHHVGGPGGDIQVRVECTMTMLTSRWMSPATTR